MNLMINSETILTTYQDYSN